MIFNDKRVNTRRGYYTHYIYVPNIGSSKYIKQTLTKIKGEIHRSTHTKKIGDINTPLTSMDKLSGQTSVRSRGAKRHNRSVGLETFFVFQWLRCHAPNAVGAGSIPSPGIQIPHAAQSKKQKTKK